MMHTVINVALSVFWIGVGFAGYFAGEFIIALIRSTR